jgi:hypothetical protein
MRFKMATVFMKNALEPNPKPALPTNTKEYKEYA